MPRHVCCVPDCPIVASDGIVLHNFPNPKTNFEKFQIWVKKIGGDIASLDDTSVYKTRRICRRHFEKQFLYPKNRLCSLAVPTLLLPSGNISASTRPLDQDSKSTSQEGLLLNPEIQQSEATNTNVTVKYNPDSATSPLVPACKTSISQEVSLLNPEIRHSAAITVDYKPSILITTPIPDCQSSTPQGVCLLTPKIQPFNTVKSVKCWTESETLLQREQEENRVKKLTRQLHNALKAKQMYRNKYLLAKKMTKTNAFNIVTKNLSPAAKALLFMQTKGSGKSARGRRFTHDEKALSLTLHKLSPEAYCMLRKLFVLPSKRTLRGLAQKTNSMLQTPAMNKRIKSSHNARKS